MAKAPQAAGLHRASLTKLHDLDAALELMYYGWRGMTLEADAYLAKQGLSRPHHRILYVVARRPDIAIGALIEIPVFPSKPSTGRSICWWSASS